MASSSTGASNEVGSNFPAANSRMPPGAGSLKKFIWDSDNKTFLGRNGGSWAKITLFYIVFFFFLAGWFALLLTVFYQTISYDQPTYTGDESILRNAGLAFRPLVHVFEDKKYQLSFNINDQKITTKFAEEINTFLKPYGKQSESRNFKSCPWNSNITSGEQPCQFDLQSLNSSCSRENNWGFSSGSPCFVFKLNKMIGFLPEPVKDVADLPSSLQDHITEAGDAADRLAKHVWVWCEGDKNVELEQPLPGLPLVYYPYTHQNDYLSPLSIIRIRAPVGVKVKVTCKVLSPNIPLKVETRLTGMAEFIITMTNTSTTKTGEL